MNHYYDFNSFWLDSVNDSIILKDTLSQIFFLIFWHYPADVRKRWYLFDDSNDSLSENPSVML